MLDPRSVRNLAALLSVLLGISTCGAGTASISGDAYTLLVDRTLANRSAFYVYLDADSGFNHGFPSGKYPPQFVSKVDIDPACIDDPTSTNGCSSDLTRLDRVRSTVFRITFSPFSQGQFAGFAFEEPNGYSTTQGGIGYDLTGCTRIVFDVRTPTPGGVSVVFGVNGNDQVDGSGQKIFTRILPASGYQTIAIPISAFGVSSGALRNVHTLFSLTANDLSAPNGGTILVDNVRFEPPPTNRANVLGFPVATQTFGVVPVQNQLAGRVPVPMDQLLRGVTTTYESALTLMALLRLDTPSALAAARQIADAFEYAVTHENRGLPLPDVPGVAMGLHNAYASGDLALLNGQGIGAAQAGEVRLAGFTAGALLCPGGFCLLLDGATAGNNGLAILGLAAAYRRFQDVRYLNAALAIGNWIVTNLADPSQSGFGGYFNGYPDQGKPKNSSTLDKGKSTENNADVLAAFLNLADIQRQLGNASDAEVWTTRAYAAGDFVLQMFDRNAGRYNAGSVPVGAAAGPGVTPNGPAKGSDVTNTFDFLDANTFTLLAMGHLPRYREQIDWRRSIAWILQHQALTVNAAGQEFQGFSLTARPTDGPNGIAWEFTGQTVVALQEADLLYGETSRQEMATKYLGQLRKAQTTAPYTDGRGIPAATMPNGDRLTPVESCISTPFQCIPERVGLASTVWAVYGEQHFNPFRVPPNIAEGGVLNAASFNGAPDIVVSPGSLVSIFGTNLGHTSASATLVGGALPFVYAGTAVVVNGSCAAIIYVSPGQINAQVPVSLPIGGTTSLVVATGAANSDCQTGTFSSAKSIQVGEYSPALVTIGGGTGSAAALHQDNITPVTNSSPAAVSEYVVLFGIGFGPTQQSFVEGQLAAGLNPIKNPIQVTLDGAPLERTAIAYAGRAPGLAGVYQFNIQIPATASPGAKPIKICVSGFCSQAGVYVPVAPLP